MRSTVLILIHIMFVIFPGCIVDISNEKPPPTISVFGIVLDKATELPLSGVKITIGDRETTTNANGAYAVSNLTKGVQSVRAQIDGYASFDRQVYILNDETEIHIELETYNAYCNRVKSKFYEGTTYNTVLVGNQCWFKENLNVGTRIDMEVEPDNNGIVEKYCYGDSVSNCDVYGGLYKWDEAMNYTSANYQGICPNGWHVPSSDEYHVLGAYVNENGNALKADGAGDPENYPEGVGTNESGWTGLLAGTQFQDDGGAGPIIFAEPGFPRWWSSTENNNDISINFGLFEQVSNTFYEETPKYLGLSIRCLKD